MLMIVCGVSGVATTPVAREAARATGAVPVHLDVVEAALAAAAAGGATVAQVLVRDALAGGRHVVVDAGEAVPTDLRQWHDLAAAVGVPSLTVRVGRRDAEGPGAADGDGHVVEVAATPLHAAVTALAATVRACPEQVSTPERLLAPTHALGRAGAGEVVLSTDRLLLRRWSEADLEPFAAMGADPEVMRHLGGVIDRQASDDVARSADAAFEVHGYGLSVVQRRSDASFLGFVGLHHHRSRPDDVEVGWRLRQDAWGHGYAVEAARAWVVAARQRHGLRRLISITTPANTASLAVMGRLGMAEESRRSWGGFDLVVHALEL